MAGLSLSQAPAHFTPPGQLGMPPWDVHTHFPQGPYPQAARPGLLPPELWEPPSQSPGPPTTSSFPRSSNDGSRAFPSSQASGSVASWGMAGYSGAASLPDNTARSALHGLGPWLPSPSMPVGLSHLQQSTG